MSSLTAPMDPTPVAVGDLGDRMVALRRAVRAADWPDVLALGVATLGVGRAWSGQLIAAATAYDATLRAATHYRTVMGTAFGRLATRPDHASVAGAARAQLVAHDPALALRLEPILARIEQGGDTFAEMQATPVHHAAPAARAHDLAVAAMSRGLRAVAHQTFAAAAPDPSGVSLATTEATLTELRAVVAAARDAFAAHEQALHDAVDAGTGVREAATALAEHVEAGVLSLVAAQSRAGALATALRDAGRGGDAERVGAVLLRGALLCRTMFAAHAAGLAVAAESGLSTLSPAVAAVLAAGIDHDRRLPVGLSTEIAQLAGTTDGTLVRVRGIATDVGHRRETDGKLVGEVTLLDPSSGAEVRVAVVFVHLANAGLTLGSFVEAHGVLQATPLLGGARGIVVDVLPLTELARTSWRLRLQALGSRWAPVWRNAHHVVWSWGAHAPGDDTSVTADRGAAELVFTPFLREV